MSKRKEILRKLVALCDEPRPGDGQDPRYDRKQERNANGERKTWQLCKQIATAVQLALGTSTDERLRELLVVRVTPAPEASHLLLLVQPNSPISSSEEEMNEALAKAQGYLRTAAAEAITRKKTPHLTMRFLPFGMHQEGSP
ncbi:MAG: ribosome-binding factor A [Deltaproteobacteria bacterium]|nr:ribosome-binding factor A [Deltaproteobacteria bacterium]